MISRRGLITAGVMLEFFRRGVAWAKDPFETLQLFRPKRQTTAPAFTVPGLGGSPIRLGDFKGQVILLNFWATWCPPCREEMPSMERLYRRFKAKGFTILALSIDAKGEEVVGPFVKKFGLTFSVGLDAKSTVAGEYRMAGLPTSIVIDRRGVMAAVAAGARDWDSAAADQVIERLLGSRDPRRALPLLTLVGQRTTSEEACTARATHQSGPREEARLRSNSWGTCSGRRRRHGRVESVG